MGRKAAYRDPLICSRTFRIAAEFLTNGPTGSRHVTLEPFVRGSEAAGASHNRVATEKNSQVQHRLLRSDTPTRAQSEPNDEAATGTSARPLHLQSQKRTRLSTHRQSEPSPQPPHATPQPSYTPTRRAISAFVSPLLQVVSQQHPLLSPDHRAPNPEWRHDCTDLSADPRKTPDPPPTQTPNQPVEVSHFRRPEPSYLQWPPTATAEID